MALLAWDRDHPESTLMDVLRKVSVVIEKTLVKGLAQVIKLGADLSSADSKLRDFAFSVVQWITDLKSKIESFGNEEFAKVAWENLAKVREIVDKICEWAQSRLADKRWSKFDMDNNIAQFEMLVQKAQQTFTELSLLTITGDISMLQNTLEEIQKAHKQQEAGEEIVAEKARREVLRRELDPHTASQSTYDQQGKLPCDPDSRAEVLETIRCWIHDHSEKSQNFLWLTGDPGSGKSAITATIAREGKVGKFLWAQFFINRNLEHTTNPNMYFPTIARQLSDNSTIVEHHVHDTVVKAPTLADQMSTDQAAKLPVLVVIDGLDETNNTQLYDTATIFSHLFKQISGHPNAKILIASRTEHDVHTPFTETLTIEHVKRVHLDTEGSRAEVGLFIRNRLNKIALKHGLDPRMWPGKEREEGLVVKAAGLYIWAVTVTKFLDTRLKKQGRENPHGVIDQLKLPDKADINVLYQRILHVTYDDDQDEPTEWDLEIFRRIMGTIVVSREPLEVAQLDELLDLRGPPSGPYPADVQHFVQLFRTVLVAGMDSVTDKTFVRLHKSFFEFITINAEERFRVDLEAANAEMVLCCLQHLAKSYAVVTSTQFASTASDVKTLSYSTRYALRFGLSHLPRHNGQTLGIILDDPAITRAQFYDSISRGSNMPVGIHLSHDPSFITTSLHTHSLVWNIDNGSSTTPVAAAIHCHNPSHMLLSPDGRYIGWAGRGGRGGRWLVGWTHMHSDPHNHREEQISQYLTEAPFLLTGPHMLQRTTV
ncbi:hypothetical protein DXG01_013137 [Tephrocybe rancida]|nr:hypothetical protein DXG01_013137 [Tephrocybe rancida]